jgi:hypothetical protein
MRVSESKELRRLSGIKKEEVTQKWRELHNDK